MKTLKICVEEVKHRCKEIKWHKISQNFYVQHEKSAGDFRNYAMGSRMHFHVGASRVSGEVTIYG